MIHHRVVLGDDVVLGAGVVIGGKSKVHGVPVVGPRCVISGGAKILGPITIGEECVVGANAVVVRDVPPRSVVAGVPARVLRSDIDIADYHDGIPRAPRPDVSRTEAPAA